MKTKHVFCSMSLLLSLLLLPAVASSNIFYRPAGFVRLSIAPNQQQLVSFPFHPFATTLDELLGDQLTGSANEETADMILKWHNTVPEYLRAVKADNTGRRRRDGHWFTDFESWTPSDMFVGPGEGFFLVNQQATTQTVVLCGEVLLDQQVDITLAEGVDLIGYPFAASVDVEESGLQGQVLNADGTPAARLDTGAGYWHSQGTGTLWRASRPYESLGSDDTATPRITGMQLAKKGRGIVLTIATSGERREEIDIFYQDLTPEQGLSFQRPWHLARQSLPTRRETSITWTDRTASEELMSDGAIGRCYLVGRSDVDSDNDGVPDARQRLVFLRDPEAGNRVEPDPGDDLPPDQAAGTNGVGTVEQPDSGAGRSRGPRRRGWIVYVDRNRGQDALPGRSPVVVADDGPKKSIRAGLASVEPGDTMIVKSGQYRESLRIAGRNIKVRIKGRVRLQGGRSDRGLVSAETRSPVPGRFDMPGASTNRQGRFSTQENVNTNAIGAVR